MVSNLVWRDAVFDELVRLKRGYDLPNQDIVEGEYPVVTSTNIKAHHYKYKVEPPGVVTGRSGSLGQVQFVTEKYWPLNTALYVKDFRENNPRFAYYFLQIMKLENFNSGAGVPTLNQNHLHKLKIKLPTKKVQKKIAAILSAYDDLIENNKRRISLLENMAEEIYREWFVRFRFPGYQNAEFEKGIPKGWDEIRLDSFCEKVTDGTHDTPMPTEVGRYLVTGKNIKNSQINFSGSYFISENDHREISKRSGLKEWDILFSNIGTIGETAVVGENPDYSVKNIIIFRPKNSHQSLYLDQVLKTPAIIDHLLLIATGASQQFIGLGVARGYKILNPGSDLIELFSKKVVSILQQIKTIQKVNNKLSSTKNTLLPRLISGKLSVENLNIQFPPSMLTENMETLKRT